MKGQGEAMARPRRAAVRLTAGRLADRSQPGEAGAALVLVLIVAALLGLAALALAFTVTLDTLATRNAQEAALAESQAEGALALASEMAASVGAPLGSDILRLGPWPEWGIVATVDATWEADGTVRLQSRAVVGRSGVTRTLVARLSEGEVSVVVSRP